MTASYTPQGITRPGRRGPRPGVHIRKGRPVKAKFRQITLRIPAEQYKAWLLTSRAIQYGTCVTG